MVIQWFTLPLFQWTDNNDYPIMGSKVKGMHTKLIFLWMANKVLDVYEQGLIKGHKVQIIAKMNWGMLHFITTCDQGGLFLTQDAADEACDAGWTFLSVYVVSTR